LNCLLQRVNFAKVEVENSIIAEINTGILVFVGIEKADDEAVMQKMVKKILDYRIFADDEDKMNLSVKDISADILLVSQFTLAASTQKGRRPSFSSAAHPDISQPLYEAMAKEIEREYKQPQLGQFGADMKVSLCNDGPVTFLLHI